VIVATVVGLLFLLPFPAWGELVNVVTSASVLMYAAAPLALWSLRKQKPDLPRTYTLPGAAVLAPLAFIFATWVIVFSGWQTYTTLMVGLVGTLAVSAAWSLLIFYWAIRTRLPSEKVDEYVRDVYPPPVAE